MGVLGDAGPLARRGKSILRLPGVKIFFRGRRTRRGRGLFTSSAKFSKWTLFEISYSIHLAYHAQTADLGVPEPRQCVALPILPLTPLPLRPHDKLVLRSPEGRLDRPRHLYDVRLPRCRAACKAEARLSLQQARERYSHRCFPMARTATAAPVGRDRASTGRRTISGGTASCRLWSEHHLHPR